MATHVSAARAKAQLSELVARVAYQGERYLIERRGKPIAALVSVDELMRIEMEHAERARPSGALALVGAWGDMEDEAVDALIAAVYAERERDTGRVVELEP